MFQRLFNAGHIFLALIRFVLNVKREAGTRYCEPMKCIPKAFETSIDSFTVIFFDIIIKELKHEILLPLMAKRVVQSGRKDAKTLP